MPTRLTDGNMRLYVEMSFKQINVKQNMTPERKTIDDDKFSGNPN